MHDKTTLRAETTNNAKTTLRAETTKYKRKNRSKRYLRKFSSAMLKETRTLSNLDNNKQM